MRCITQSKFAVLSHVLPLSDSGQAVMLYRLLENIDKDNYIFILTSHNAGQSSGKGVQAKSSKKLGGKYYLLEGLDKPSLIARFFLNIPIFHGLALFALIIKKQEKQIKEILLEEKCKTIVLCTGGFFDIFSTFLVLKQLKIKLVIYSFDDFIY